MNVDIITTFLNDFATFWKNIWNFLKPIFNMVSGDWIKPEGKEDHLSNLNELSNSFGKKVDAPEGYTPAPVQGE